MIQSRTIISFWWAYHALICRFGGLITLFHCSIYSRQKSPGTSAQLSKAPHLHKRCRTCVGHSCRHSLRPPCCSVFIFLGSFDTAFHYSGGTPPRLSSSLISTGIIVSCDYCFHLTFPPFSTKRIWQDANSFSWS